MFAWRWTAAALLIATLALSGALATSASAEETKIKLELFPCLALQGVEAKGEVEWEGDTESDTGVLTVEVEGLVDRAGETLGVFVDGALVGLLTVDTPGRAHALYRTIQEWSELQVAYELDPGDLLHLYSTDPDCARA